MLKRVFDVLVSLTGIFCLSPFAILIVLILFVLNRGSVFFYHERPGFNCEPFRLIKFKTMTDSKDAMGNLLPNYLRITSFGRFMRRYSLDEIPQLWNVLCGDISLVGPRPLEMRYLKHYTEDQMRRHSVKPGITGLAQIEGRNSISWDEKFRLDVWYVNNQSFFLDLRILIKTFQVVVLGKGVNQSERETVVPFDEYLVMRKKSNEV